MSTCFCHLAESNACFTCASSMSGMWDRYPAPYGNTAATTTSEYVKYMLEDTKDEQVSPI